MKQGSPWESLVVSASPNFADEVSASKLTCWFGLLAEALTRSAPSTMKPMCSLVAESAVKPMHLLVDRSAGLPCIMEIFVFVVWEIWNIRNSKIFDNGSVSFSLWFRKFSDQVHLQLVRVREDKRISLIQWLEYIT